jgi:hypothetical protein
MDDDTKPTVAEQLEEKARDAVNEKPGQDAPGIPEKQAEQAPVEKRSRNKSKDKGNTYERTVGRQLSLWLTHGEKSSIFSRNVLSGGVYTQTAKRGGETNLPGDLAAAHPLAFNFLMYFCVEVKHNNLLALDVYLLDQKKTSFINKVVTKIAEQAYDSGLHWMFIGKQDRRPAFVLMDEPAGKALLAAAKVPLLCHIIAGTVYMVSLASMLEIVDPDAFISAFGAPPVTGQRRQLIPPQERTKNDSNSRHAPNFAPRRRLSVGRVRLHSRTS